jgi:N utilization substance protein B
MGRRKAREIALKILYAYDAEEGSKIQDCINAFWSLYPKCPKDVKEYAESLVINTIERIDKIDNIISVYIKNWKLNRLALIDRNILRIGTYELLYEALDERIIINEAVELAKKYGDAESYQLVNGILDSINKKYRCKHIEVEKAKVN